MIPSQLVPIANHLWQTTLFAGVAGLLTLLLRGNRAHVRYWLWLSASVKFLIPFSLLVNVGGLLGRHTAAAIAPSTFVSAASLSSVIEQVGEPFTTTAPQVAMRGADWSYTSVIVPVLIVVWASGFASLFCRWAMHWRRMRASVRTALPLNLPIGMPVKSSPAFGEPGVFGILRPALLLPVGIVDRLTTREMDAIVAHELCHIRRRDNLTSTIHMAVESIFWFHPLVWWVGARLMEERERACDEEVLASGGDPRAYAEGILKICELYLASPLACVAGVTGGDLKRRIEAIISNRATLRLNCVRKVALAASGIAAIAGPMVVGVISAQPASALLNFEVASVKPHELPPGAFGPGMATRGSRLAISGSRVTTTGTFLALMLEAYNLRNFQVSGTVVLPDKSGNDTLYDIEGRATGDGAVPLGQARQMLQSLLTDRFQLKFHRESKELPAYHLVAGGNSSKLRPSAPDAATKTDVLPTGRGMFHFQFTNVSVSELVIRIAPDFDRPLIDKTGLAGGYDFTLEYVHKVDTSKWSPEEKAALEKAGSIEGPSLASALQQLGLKVVPAKDFVEVLVVDHVERPSAN